ncbi:NUDIX domain-containing protein [Amycolatopsis sp. K13G38]|uniref:NUDIX domain-containing protein n=1 Tax=Amycolatopsis acididurans TaxID=2724524 RepID=A0ABX1JF65_9PSEU|nr:NUDIX domain-containing protein [Amycolatopsis acididurans]NKQ57504.1 NUDIX domain-containing protein [Amycolatopsis acididurans]
MRSREHNPVRCVGAITHDERGRLLVIQRGHDPGRGLWSLPGGRVEPGETDTQAVIREMREETGLDVRPIRLAGMVVRGRYEIYDFVCEVAGGTLRAGDDAADARWVDAEAFDTLALTDGLAETLRDWNSLPRC